ncbi:hypothetical protein OUZ56_012923 [Daphnia magna]|uniref:Uncharacterized protein n=1 Tax=Daphnia magna TaxID=35525 RepID=A0ABQ9Z4F5_9CRUS|nr:hypothetical protein OUZ56_012923 [Daphnia magna]
MEDPIGEGDPLKMELMPSTSADDNSHEADVVADESFIVDEIQPAIEKRVTIAGIFNWVRLCAFLENKSDVSLEKCLSIDGSVMCACT